MDRYNYVYMSNAQQYTRVDEQLRNGGQTTSQGRMKSTAIGHMDEVIQLKKDILECKGYYDNMFECEGQHCIR